MLWLLCSTEPLSKNHRAKTAITATMVAAEMAGVGAMVAAAIRTMTMIQAVIVTGAEMAVAAVIEIMDVANLTC